MSDLSVTIQGIREKVSEFSNSQSSYPPRLLPCLSPCARSSFWQCWGLQIWYEDTNKGKILVLQLQRMYAAGSGQNPLLTPHVFIFKLAAVPMELSCPLCPQSLIPLPVLFQQEPLWSYGADQMGRPTHTRTNCFSLLQTRSVSRVGFPVLTPGLCRDRSGVSGLNAGLLILQQRQSAKNICATTASDSIPGKDSPEMLL